VRRALPPPPPAGWLSRRFRALVRVRARADLRCAEMVGRTGIGESRMEEATAAHRPLEMETASRRQTAATRVWGSIVHAIGSAEIFAEGTAYATTT
jgi:hypothetical protein